MPSSLGREQRVRQLADCLFAILPEAAGKKGNMTFRLKGEPMDKAQAKNSGWAKQARSGNLAQRQQNTGACSKTDTLLRDVSEAAGLWSALQEDKPDAGDRCAWYNTPHEFLAEHTPGEEIAVGHYDRVLYALRPHLLNKSSKMS